MPDGTVIANVPDGTTQTELLKRYQAHQEVESGGTPRKVAIGARAAGEGVFDTLLGGAESFGKFATGAAASDPVFERMTGKSPLQYDIASFNKTFGTSIPEAHSITELLHSLVTQAGAPEPQTSGEKLGYAAVHGATSAATGGGVGGVSGAPNAIRAAVSGLTGGTSSEFARQQGVGKVGQVAAGLVGGLVPSAVEGVVSTAGHGLVNTVRPLTRGGQQSMAGKVLAEQADDPVVAASRLQQARPAVPGSARTSGEASQDIGLLAAEKGIRGRSPSNFGQRLSEQNAARQAELKSLGGTPADIAAAERARSSTTAPLREGAFNNAAGHAQTVIPIRNIDRMLASPVGKREAVAKSLQWAKDRISSTTDPASLYEIRKDLQLAQRGKLQPSSANAPNASELALTRKELGSVVDDLDSAIESAAPGFKAYLDRYKALSKPIDQMKVIQEISRRAQLTSADVTTGETFLGSANFSRALDAAIQKNGAKLTPKALDRLEAIRTDLQYGQAVNSPLVKAPGSDTFQNFSIAQALGAGSSNVHPVFRVVTKPLQWIYKIAGTDERVSEILTDAMLDPQLASKMLQQANRQNLTSFSALLRKRMFAGGIGATSSALSNRAPLPPEQRNTQTQ